MSDSLSYDFDINGFLVHAGFSRAFLEECVHGLLRRWHDQAQDKQRLIVFLAAPPAAGKSTLAALFAHEASVWASRFRRWAWMAFTIVSLIS